MMNRSFTLALGAFVIAGALSHAQQSSATQLAEERAQAELDAPKLADVLELKPGMTVADVGAGGGAMTVVLGKWIGTGRVFATDIDVPALTTIREYATREGLTNVTVIEGAPASTNLPAACCDAIFLRHVYHHIRDHAAFNKSLQSALKLGGRLAIIDFVPRKGSELPEGVPANRGGHGVPPAVVIAELSEAGLAHARTIDAWPPGDKEPDYFLVLFRK
jgi:cyclopropane fatty-acyl-phospholipid synthase-like methyltransferase